VLDDGLRVESGRPPHESGESWADVAAVVTGAGDFEVGAVRMRGPPPAVVLEAPVGAVLSTRPELRCTTASALAHNARLRVIELDAVDASYPVIPVDCESVAWPQGFELARGQTYRLRLEAGDGSHAAEQTVRVASADEFSELSALVPAVQAPFSRRLLYALSLLARGFAQDAHTQLKVLAQERPEAPQLQVLAERAQALR
jgi:hypothetical protein